MTQRLLAVSIALLSLVTPTISATPSISIPKTPFNPEIYRAIKTLTPTLEDKKARKISGIIDHYSRQYKIDWKIAVAIFRQESSFDISAINWETKDFGIGQMHYKTIKHRKLDLGALLTNEAYAIRETFKFLAELRNDYAKIDKRKGLQWYTRYHSFTPSFRRNYAVLLDKHLEKIRNINNERGKEGKQHSTDYAYQGS